MRDDGENPLGNRKSLRVIGAAAGLGFTVVTSLLLGIAGGLLLDRWIGTTPIFTLLGVALGIFMAAWALYRLVSIGR